MMNAVNFYQYEEISDDEISGLANTKFSTKKFLATKFSPPIKSIG